MDFHLERQETCRGFCRRPFKGFCNKGSKHKFKESWEPGPSVNATSSHSHGTATSLNVVIHDSMVRVSGHS